MQIVKPVLAFLAAVARIFLFDWIPALRHMWRKLREIFQRWWERQKLPGRARKASDAACIPVREEAFKRPDPLIYSQYDLMARGYAVTWDNPDIELRKGGVTVPSSQIDPNTDYEIVARIWNNSTDSPIVGLPVIFYYLSFGTGIQGHLIGATAVNLGVKGGTGHPAFASMKWTTPVAAGHFCIMVLLSPADDLNFNNNLGQENLNVGNPHSPAEFAFTLRNETRRDQAFRLEVDTYSLPDMPLCGEAVRWRPEIRGEVRPEAAGRRPVPPQHDRRNHPVPPGWVVAFDPPEPSLAAGSEATVKVQITPPAGFRGRQPFNVNAFDRDGFAGGVTFYVEAN